MNKLTFNIGPERYVASIAPEPIIHNGKECLGLAIHQTREILLSPGLPPSQRLNTLFHELRHAFEFHFPATPATREEEATTAATIMKSVFIDLIAQGGIEAVENLEPATPMKLSRKGVA